MKIGLLLLLGLVCLVGLWYVVSAAVGLLVQVAVALAVLAVIAALLRSWIHGRQEQRALAKAARPPSDRHLDRALQDLERKIGNP